MLGDVVVGVLNWNLASCCQRSRQRPPLVTRCPSLSIQGDVKGYLRSCRTAESMTPEPLILQQMACDIASGLLHLHKHNFTHRYCNPWSMNICLLLLGASWNKILVLPECCLPTPASVILLRAATTSSSSGVFRASCSCLVCLHVKRRCSSCLPPSVHSDLALRNCLLTADVSVKIGDYGLSHTKYKVPHMLRGRATRM